jgi:type II secretory pathway pseudopilin PulG
LRNNKGFTITEALVALAILMIISTAVLPLSSFVSHERKALSQKRIITYKLHDKLQLALHDGVVPSETMETIELADVTFQMNETDENFYRACANWKNIVNRQEEVCLYGLPEK